MARAEQEKDNARQWAEVAAEKLEHVLETSGSYAEIMVEFLGGRLKEAAGSARST